MNRMKSRDQERSSGILELKIAPSRPQSSKSPCLSNATFLVANATSIDLAAWAAEEESDRAKLNSNCSSAKEIKEYIFPERFTVRTLKCLLQQAADPQVEGAGSPRT